MLFFNKSKLKDEKAKVLDKDKIRNKSKDCHMRLFSNSL